MNRKHFGVAFITICSIFLIGTAGGLFLGKPSSEPIAEPAAISDSVAVSAPIENSEEKSLFVYDTSALQPSFDSWMIFSETFHASFRDSTFIGNYQLTYPLSYPLDTLQDSKFDRLLLSLIFGKRAPKTVNRKSIQEALDSIMKADVESTHSWWNESKVTYGERWRDEVCLCSGYFYTMPTIKSSQWMTLQKITDSRCGGNGGPLEEYYTIVTTEDPYIMDTTVFVPDFREKLMDMITDNVIYNFYLKGRGVGEIGREEIRQATINQFKGNFNPTLTLSGVKFVFGTWGLPGTCHADGQIPVIIPYKMIQEIFTDKFKNDIGL